MFVKAITYNGDAVVRDSLFLAADTPSRQVVITLSDKVGELEGRVVREGKPLSEAYVILAPSSMKPINGWPQFTLARADADGRFRARGLIPGDYRVTALSPAEWEQAQMPGILAAKVSVATQVEVKEAETKSIQIE